MLMQPALPLLDEDGRQQRMKPARQTRSMRWASSICCSDGLEGCSPGVDLVIDRGDVDALRLRGEQGRAPRACSTGPARFRPETAAPATLRSARPCWSRGRRSGSRCAASAHSVSRPVVTTASPSRAMISPTRTGFSPAFAQGALDFVRLCGLRDDDHADAAVERAQHFRFGDAAFLRQPGEDRQDTSMASRSRRSRSAVGQHARNVVREAAAGDVRQRLDRRRSPSMPRAAASHRCASA